MDDTKLIGGMSLEHFDPAHPDPSIAGMMVSKLQYGAMRAADRAMSAAGSVPLTYDDAADVFVAGAWTKGSLNVGGRVVFDKAGMLYASVGDRGPTTEPLAQDLSNQ